MGSKWVEIQNNIDSSKKIQDIEVPINQDSKWRIASSKISQVTPENEKTSWRETISGALYNAIPSMAGVAKDMYMSLFGYPSKEGWQGGLVKTAKTLGTLAKGAGKAMVGIEGEDTDTYMALEDTLKKQYGTIEGFKKYLKDNPAGVLSDIASIVIPAGKLATSAGFAKTGEKIAKIGSFVEPVNLGTKSIRKITKVLIPEKVPSRLYESAVKLSTTLPIDDAKKIVNTALENQIMPTYKGITKLSDQLDELNSQIVQTIDKAVNTGQKIPVNDLFKGFHYARVGLLSTSGQPLKGLKLFNSVENEIRKANEMLGRKNFDPFEAQKMKQRIYKELENEYSKIAIHPIKVEAQMLIAKNLRESIEKIVPEIKQLNAKDGELLELRDAITQATRRITNRDLLSLGTTAKAAGGGAIAGVPGIAMGLTIGLLDSQPIIKSKLALVLFKLKTKGITVSPNKTLIRLGLYQTGNLQQYDKENEQ